jgi:hypothetical protein
MNFTTIYSQANFYSPKIVHNLDDHLKFQSQSKVAILFELSDIDLVLGQKKNRNPQKTCIVKNCKSRNCN